MSSFLLLGVGADAGGGGGATTTTWDPANTSGAITLSNGNLTATSTSSVEAGTRSIVSHSSGKYYWEVTCGPTQSFGDSVGVADASWLYGTNYLGQDSHGVGWANDGEVFFGGVTVATIQTWTNNNVLCIAFDAGNNKIWYRTNGGNWNNDVIANQNPATNTGGISIATMGATKYAACRLNFNTNAFTANFGATAYSFTAPSGFGNL